MYLTPAFQTVLVICFMLKLCQMKRRFAILRELGETLHFSCLFLRCLILKVHQSFSNGFCLFFFCDSNLHHKSQISPWPSLPGLFFADLLDRNVLSSVPMFPQCSPSCPSVSFTDHISAFLLKLFFFFTIYFILLKANHTNEPLRMQVISFAKV